MGLYADSVRKVNAKRMSAQRAGMAGLASALSKAEADRARIAEEAAAERAAQISKGVVPAAATVPTKQPMFLNERPAPTPIPAPVSRTTPSFLLPAQGMVEGFAQMPANIAKGAEMAAYGAASVLPRAVAGVKRDYRSVDFTPKPATPEPSYKQPDQWAAVTAQRRPLGESVQDAGTRGVEGARQVMGTPDLSTAGARGLYGLGALPVSVATYASPIGAVAGPLMAAGRAAGQAEEAGASMDQQFVNAAVAGGVEAALLKVGASREAGELGKVLSGAAPASKSAISAGLRTVLRTGGEEAIESIIESVTDSIAAQSTYAPDTKIADPKQLAEAALFGFVFGGIAGAPRIMAEARAAKSRAVREKMQAEFEEAINLRIAQEDMAAGGAAPTEEPDFTLPLSRVAEAVEVEKTLNEMSELELAATVERSLPEVQRVLEAERQREYNEAYWEWDQTVNEFDERDSTPESRAAWRKSIEPVLKRYESAEQELNVPITAEYVTRMLTAGAEPVAVFDVIAKNIPKKRVIPTQPIPAPVVDPNLTAQPYADRRFVPQSRQMPATAPQAAATTTATTQAPVAAAPGAPAAMAAPVASDAEVNLQQFGLQTPGPLDGQGPVVPSKMSENIAADRVGNAAISEAYRDDPATHQQLTHSQTLAEMEARFAAYDGTADSLMRLYDDWADRVENGKYDTADVAMTRVLANEFSKHGIKGKGEQAYAILIERQTEAGRLVDASKLLYDAAKKDPAVAVATMDTLLRKINKEGYAKYGDKWDDFTLTKEERDAFLALKKPDGTFDAEGYDALKDKVVQRIADTMPRSMWEKLNSWRRFAMLTSPKTHMRNILSNTIRLGLEETKDVVAFGFERMLNIPKAERTKALDWKHDGVTKNQARVAAVDKALADHKAELSRKVKYEISNLKSVEIRKNAFRPGSMLDKASSAVMAALEAEDVWAMEPAFRSALGQMMKARGTDTPSPEMIQRAMDTAWDVTFKKINGLSRLILDMKRSTLQRDMLHMNGSISRAIGLITEAVIPFVTTPAAIAKSTVEFSPVGFMTALLSAKTSTKADIADKLARATTGTITMLLGYLAAEAGLAFGDDEKSKKAKEIQEMGGGRQKFSMKIPDYLGGGTFTMDWVQPLGTVFFVGAQMGQAAAKGEADYDPDKIADLIFTGGETFFNMSLLQGVKRMLGGQGSSTTEGIASAVVDYAEQFIPTLFTQVVQTIDKPQRISYDQGWVTSQMKGIQSRVLPAGTPGGAIKPLEPYVDPFGEEKTRGESALWRGVQNILLPGFYRPETNDPVAAELYDLYQRTKATDVLPKEPPAGLTPEQQTAFRKAQGVAAKAAAQAEFNKPDYDGLSPDEQVKRLRRAMQKVYDEQKKKLAK